MISHFIVWQSDNSRVMEAWAEKGVRNYRTIGVSDSKAKRNNTLRVLTSMIR